MRRKSNIVVGLFVVGCMLPGAPGARAQSVLDRTPNVSGGWVGAPGSVHFNFLHRFNNSGAPQRQVTNRPTFLMAYRLPWPVLMGAHYATRSDIVDRYPNEWEVFGRYAPLQEDNGAVVDAAAQLGYNVAAESVDGELSVARRLGPLRVLGAVRGFSGGYGGGARYAFAGGATLRLAQWLSLAVDGATLLESVDDEKPAWGAALQLALPLTPHSFSLQVSNTNTASLQGSSRGASEKRYGFEFTVPVALARYTTRRAEPQVAVAPPPPPDADSMRAALADSITRVVWSDVQARLRADSAAASRAAAAQRQFADSVRQVARADSIRSAASADSLRRVRDAEAQRAAATPPPTFRAGMRNLAYTPTRIEITAGTTVTWRNNDQVEHTVTALNRSFDSGMIRPGASWSRRFDRPGTYEIYCTPHPFMKATIVVRAR